MARLYRYLRSSDDVSARLVRGLVRRLRAFSLPVPRVVCLAMLWAYLGIRTAYYFAFRVLVCEPLFKAYCTRYGRGLRTDAHIHFVEGRGEILIGDDVLIDGKCCFAFSSRYAERATLIIGDHSGLGHNCKITVARRIAIGRHCRIASDVWMFDSSGHASDPAARLAGAQPGDEEVRPVTVRDNVWIGRRCIIFPGVTIGEGSIVSAGSVVMGDVPPYTVVAGNPARKVASLRPLASQPDEPAESRAEASVGA